MIEIKEVIKNNLIELRRESGLTQNELAIKLNYSDKSISKWERGESIPDIETLVLIASIYNVSLEYLISEKHEKKDNTNYKSLSHLIITLLSLSVLWLIILTIYSLIYIISRNNVWQLFILAIPLSSTLTLIFNCIWGKKPLTHLFITIIVWSILLTIYVFLVKFDVWPVFLIGIPLQIADFLWFILTYKKK